MSCAAPRERGERDDRARARRLPGWLRALRHRDFRLFWAGQLVSLVGTWMQSVAQAWLVLELTASPLRLGLIGVLQFGPFLLLSFPAGAIADRLPKRRLMLGTQAALMLQSLALGLLAWLGQVEYWHVAVLAAVLGVANSVDMPARQSFIVEMVGKEELVNAIALNSAAFNGARIVGPAVAGVLIARWGVAVAILLNAATFAAVLGALLAVRTQGLSRRTTGTSLAAEIREALVYAARTPRVVLVLGLLLSVSLFAMNHTVLVPLLSREVLGLDASGFGALLAMLGIGALAGAIALAAFGPARPPVAAIVAPALVLGSATLAMGFVRAFWLAAALLLVMGASGLVFMASCNTTVQLAVPDAMRGRLMGLYTLVFVGSAPAGSFLVGWIAEHGGAPTAFLAGGSCALVAIGVVVGSWRVWRQRMRQR